MSTKAWSEEEETKLKNLYLNQTQDIEEIAQEFPHKGYRSIISKLVQLKIYQKPEEAQPDKTKTVKLMLRDLEIMLDIEIEGTNLNKKENLKNLVESVTKLYNLAYPTSSVA